MANMTSPQILFDVGSKTMEDKPQPTTMLSWFSAKWRSILAEFLSTSILVLFGCLSCIPIDGLSEMSPFYIPMGFGLTVMINTQIFGHISLALMNPALTLAAVIWGKIPIVLGICYFIAQIGGALVGYGVLITIAPMEVRPYGICVPFPHMGLSNFQAVCIEAILTGVLSLFNCGIWHSANQHKQDSAAVKFGLAVIGLSIVGGPLTGASLNSARTLAVALWTGLFYAHWIYWVGPFVGAGVAATLYKLLFAGRDYLPIKLL